jgi:LysR family glycine cleavage system transcriptional activator
MPYHLPSLNALRAFEAAARHLSFKEAARELFVTRGAVSQQVKALESELGVPLFRRLTRQIVLTAEGQALLPKVRQAFQLISSASEGLMAGQQSATLTISTFPSFAAKWLVPRLGSFTEHHPEIDVRVGATPEVVNFARGGVDLAIRQGQGDYSGLHSDFLLHAELFPVCSPALLKGPLPLREPADLGRHHLLHHQRAAEWELWLRAHNVEGVDLSHGTRFSDDALVLEAAINGQGVAITREPLATADLAAGLLVRPFPHTIPDLFAYYLVCLPERANEPKIAAFREWIVQEMREDPHWRG